MKKITVKIPFNHFRILVILVGLVTALGTLLVVRSVAVHHYFYGWVLPWNLFLALMPLGLASYCRQIAQRLELSEQAGNRRYFLNAKLSLAAVAWALFFPNAPYLITDLMHLRKVPGVPLWFDGAMLFGFALTGLLAGLISLYWMHQLALRFWSKRRVTALVAGYIPLAAWGIYLGRELRWNSWDILTRPHILLWDSLTRGTSLGALVLTAEFSLLIGFSYLMLLALIEWNPKRE